MALTPAQLWQEAQSGKRKLDSQERKHVVAYLMQAQPELTNGQMASVFGVSEKMIRIDKDTIRRKMSSDLRKVDVVMYLSDIDTAFTQQIRDLESGKKHAHTNKPGSKTYLDYCIAIAQMHERKVRLLQDLGLLPKNIGQMTIDKYEFRANVGKDGAVHTERVVNPIDVTPEDTDGEEVTSNLLPEHAGDGFGAGGGEACYLDFTPNAQGAV